MDERHYFADVNLPFHVWVRERSAGKSRWVLRDASHLEKNPGQGRAGTEGTGRRPPLQAS